ncbi:hypothetical protein DFJ73DRAFT_265938 [Zopfochytrium polystomum]|nr:hypothetical protein DFJ73DRAFT_265938 [Zopfochytrium polystomum]
MLDGAVGRGVGSYGSWAIAKSSASNLLQWGMEEMTKPTSDDEQRTSVALLRLLRAFVNHEPHGLPFLLSTAKISLDALFGLTCSQLSPNAKNDGGNNGAGGLEHVDAACQLLFRLLRAVHTSKAPSVSKNFPSLLRSLVSALTLATQSTNTTATANLLSTLHNLLTVYTGPVDADNVISLGAIHVLIDCCKDTTRELPAIAKTTQHQTPSLALTALAKLLSRATTGGGEAAQRTGQTLFDAPPAPAASRAARRRGRGRWHGQREL